MDAFQMELVRRLPLAQATLGLLDYAIDATFLDRCFEEHRGRCYESVLKFSSLVGLIRDALLVHDGSGHRSIQEAQEDRRLDVAQSSVYRKLGNLPQSLSEALLREGSGRLLEVAAQPARTLPACVRTMKTIAIDGKELKKVSKRLKATRAYTSGSLLGGKLLVALSVQDELAVAMSSNADGEANEVPLVPALVAQVRAHLGSGILWLADRQFTDLKSFALLGLGQDHFVIRCNKSIGFHVDPQKLALEQRDAQGRRVVQEWGMLGSPKNKDRRHVRRITLYRPGEKDDVIVVTDLLDESTHPGLELLELYHERWGIERCFQQVTEVFGLETLIGTTPRGVIFQAALCLLLYNTAQIIRGHVAQTAQKPVAQVSTENVFYQTTRELVSWSTLGDEPAMPVAVPREAKRMKLWLRERLKNVWQESFVKHTKKKPRNRKKKRMLPGGHGSLWKLLVKAGHPHTTSMANK